MVKVSRFYDWGSIHTLPLSKKTIYELAEWSERDVLNALLRVSKCVRLHMFIAMFTYSWNDYYTSTNVMCETKMCEHVKQRKCVLFGRWQVIKIMHTNIVTVITYNIDSIFDRKMDLFSSLNDNIDRAVDSVIVIFTLYTSICCKLFLTSIRRFYNKSMNGPKICERQKWRCHHPSHDQSVVWNHRIQ